MILPLYSFTCKFHKDPIGWRCLCFSHRHVLQEPAQWMTKCLKALQPGLSILWDNVFVGSVVLQTLQGCCGVLKTSHGVTPIMQHYNLCREIFEGQLSIQTREFERLYTGLPQGDFIAKLKALIVELWELHAGQQILVVSASGHVWHDARSLPAEAQGGARHVFRVGKVEHYVFTVERASAMLEVLVFQSFFRIGDAVFQQIEGIPMSLHPCVHFANFYLYSYELDVYRNLVRVYRTVQRALRPH